MKEKRILVAVAAVTLSLAPAFAMMGAAMSASSCSVTRWFIEDPVGVFSADAVRDAVALVVARHDAYVAADGALSDDQKLAALTDSDAVTTAVAAEGATVSAQLVAPHLLAVCDRHDAYVAADGELSQLHRDVYLESTTRLRSLLAAAGVEE